MFTYMYLTVGFIQALVSLVYQIKHDCFTFSPSYSYSCPVFSQVSDVCRISALLTSESTLMIPSNFIYIWCLP